MLSERRYSRPKGMVRGGKYSSHDRGRSLTLVLPVLVVVVVVNMIRLLHGGS
jgi:hypothetical protein